MPYRSPKVIRLAWLAVPLAVVVLGLGFVLRSNDAARRTALEPRASVGTTANSEGARLDAGASSAERAASTSTLGASESKDESTEPALGRLNIRVVDDATSAPIAGAECTVYSERGGSKVHAKLTTDADGRASVENLPVNTILVSVRRTPTHAAAFGGVWLKRAETRDLVVRIAAGSTVTGRVVDDTGAPLAGAEILVGGDLEPRGDIIESILVSTNVAATAGSDGRFEIPHMVPRPRSVWIVDGEMRPEFWDGSALYARSQGRTAAADTGELKASGTIDMGDIVIERNKTWRGRIVDAHDAAVAGALVTQRYQRRSALRSASNAKSPDALWPGLDGFRLVSGEVLTGSDGSFTLVAQGKQREIIVWTRDGIPQEFELAELAPGATSELLELRLKDWSVLGIELVDAHGARVTTVNPRFGKVRRAFNSSHRSTFARTLCVGLSGARDVRLEIPPGPDGIFRAIVAGPIAGLTRLHLALDGYLDVIQDIATPLASGDRLRFTLVDQPAVRLHIAIAAQEAKSKEARIQPYIEFAACLLDAGQRTADEGHSLPCCGLGSSLFEPLEAGERDLELPVLANRPFWIHASISMTNPPWTAHFGPFDPGNTPNQIEIPSIDPELFAAWKAQSERTAPPPSAPGEYRGCGTLVFRVVDAKTGAPLDGAYGEVVSVPETPRNMPSFFPVMKSGRVSNNAIPAGRFELYFSAQGYKQSNTSTVTIVAGETTDLGTIALDSAPVHKLSITESDGAPIRSVARVVVSDLLTWRELFRTLQNTNGEITVRAELPDRFLVLVQEGDDDLPFANFCAKQTVEVTLSAEGTTHVRLEPWCALEIRIGGAITELPWTALRVLVRRSVAGAVPEPGTETAGFGEHNLLLADELEPLADGRRRFRAYVAAGSFVVEATSALFSIPKTAIEVRKMAELQAFELSSAH
jgi:hypothetical protein